MPEENKTPETDQIKSTIPSVPQEEEESDDDILALRDQVAAKIAEKTTEQKMYSEKDVEALLKKFEKNMAKRQEKQDEDFIDLLDTSKVKRKFVRVTRINNKFVVGKKNINTDPYIDTPVYTINVENPNKKGDMIPWSTFICDDGSEELYPELAFVKLPAVWAEVINEKSVDVSKTFGVIDVKIVDDSNEWDMKNSGKKVLAKALQSDITYVCREIKGGRQIDFHSSVVNQCDASYAELKKYLEETE